MFSKKFLLIVALIVAFSFISDGKPQGPNPSCCDEENIFLKLLVKKLIKMEKKISYLKEYNKELTEFLKPLEFVPSPEEQDTSVEKNNEDNLDIFLTTTINPLPENANKFSATTSSPLQENNNKNSSGLSKTKLSSLQKTSNASKLVNNTEPIINNSANQSIATKVLNPRNVTGAEEDDTSTISGFSVTTLSANFTTPTRAFSAVYDGSSSIYLIGGRTRDSFSSSIHRFDIDEKKLEENIGFLPYPVYGGSAIWDKSSKSIIYFGGVLNTSLPTDNILKYSLAKNESSILGKLPINAGNFHTTAASISDNGETLIFGGYEAWFVPSNEIIRYSNIKGDTSNKTRGKLPYPTNGQSSIYYPRKNAVFLFGGGDLDEPSRDILQYDIKSGKTTILENNLGLPTIYSSAVEDGSGNAYIVGGWHDSKSSTGVVKFNLDNYATTSLIFKEGEGLPPQLHLAPAVYISKAKSVVGGILGRSTKRIYIFGGKDQNNDFRRQILRLDFSFMRRVLDIFIG